MPDSDEDTAMWPISPDLLVDTESCPSCFAGLTGTTCTHCGLVLTDPRAARILELGQSMLELEAKRQQLISAIRLVQSIASAPQIEPEPEPDAAPLPASLPAWADYPAPAVAPAELAVEVVVAPAPVAVRALDLSAAAVEPVAVQTPSIPAPPPPTASVPADAPLPRRRLSVPVLLLIVGVSLVGIAAIFFLVLAWNIADIRVRALIIGGVTLATMIVASLLRRWSLMATAEAIGVLGVILLGLDAWAVHANNLFGAGEMDPVVYAGVATLAVGVACRVWSMISRLRGPDLAATLALPTGVGLVVAGLLPLSAGESFTAGLLGTAVGGLAHALPAPWSAARAGRDAVPERTALAVIGVAALVGGAAASLLLGLDSMAAQLLVSAVVILLGVAYAVLLRPRAEDEPLPASHALAQTTGALAAAFAASLGWQLTLHSDLPVYRELVAPVVAVGVAVLLDRLQARGRSLMAPRIAAAVVGVVSIAALVLLAAVRAGQAVAESWVLWETAPFAAPAGFGIAPVSFAAAAAVIVAVLLFFAPTLDRPVLRDWRAIGAAAIVTAGGWGTGIPAVIAGTGMVIAALALLALARGIGARRWAWGVVAALGALTAFFGGLASPWLWAVGVLIAVAVPIAARLIVRPVGVPAVILTLTPVLVLAVTAFVAPSAIAAAVGVALDPRAGLALVQWVAIAALGAAILLRLDAPSRTGLAASSYGLVGISLLAVALGPVAAETVSAWLGEPILGIVRGGVLLALLTPVALARTRLDGAASFGAAVLLGPVAASLAVALHVTLNATEDGWAALSATGAAALVVGLGAFVPARAYGIAIAEWAALPVDAAPEPAPAPYPTLARRFADVGAAATIMAAAGTANMSPVAPDVRWGIAAVIALAFAAASVTRGWAAPLAPAASATESGRIPETRAVGGPLSQAPRRILAWPAFAAATLALWFWLDSAGADQIEAFVLPPAVGLLLFAGALVWLRRRAEATLAVVLSFSLGLVVPAIVAAAETWGFAGVAGSSDSEVRGAVVAIVAATAAVLLAWTPIRRVGAPALAGAVVALLALAIVAVVEAVADPVGTGRLLLLVGVAYGSAFGFLRGADPRTSPLLGDGERPRHGAERAFAAIVPPITLALAAFATLPSAGEPLIVTVALALVAELHLGAAALDRHPLGAPTRWTAFAAAVLVAVAAFAWGDIDAVELLSLPIAAVLLGGAALAMWRRAQTGQAWPGGERMPWLAGLALAVTPSILAVPDDPRTWLVIAGALLAAVGCIVAPIPDSAALKAPSAILLSVGALAMGLRALASPAVTSGEFAAIVAGAGAVAVAAAMVWMSESDAAPRGSTALAAAGAVLLIAVVVVQSEGELAQATLTAIIGGVIGVGGAAMLRWPRWAGIGAALAIGGLSSALFATGRRFALVAGDGGIESDVWALAGVGILVAVGIMALRSTASAAVGAAVGVVFSIALVLFAAAELVLLAVEGGDQWRTVLTMSALTGAGIVGWVWRARLGVSFAPTAAALAVVFGLASLIAFGVSPVELVSVPVALGLTFLGARALWQNPDLRTWPALGPGLALLTVPSLLYDFGATTLWRVVALGVVAITLVVVGAVWRLQAPLILGSVVVLVHAVNQLWPWISQAYEAVPWWLWLGVGGALLIFLAARYERRMRALRSAFTAVTSLR